MEAFPGERWDRQVLLIIEKRKRDFVPKAKFYIITFNLARGPVSVENYKI